jgi:hypothetical protein
MSGPQPKRSGRKTLLDKPDPVRNLDHMYFVEVSPGKQTVYRDDREFTAAIVRGEVNSQARIYHRAQSIWLPVTLHPQFRKAVAMRSAGPPPRAQWTFLRAQEAEEEVQPTPPPAEASADEERAEPAGRSGRSWRRMFGKLIGHH